MRGLAHQRVLVRLGYELELHVSAIKRVLINEILLFFRLK